MVFQAVQQRPIASIKKTVEMPSLVATTVSSALDRLRKMGIVDELTDKRRNRLYAYRNYLKLL